MAIDTLISADKENAAIDMNIQMVMDDLVQILDRPVEEILPRFLQSRTCATLYDRETKLWWDGPSVIVELYLEEIHEKKEPIAINPFTCVREVMMNERSQITYMQVRLVRMATEKWNVSVAEAARVFQQYQVFEFIRDCFGIFHVEGDEAVWEEIVPYLQVRGYDFRTI